MNMRDDSNNRRDTADVPIRTLLFRKVKPIHLYDAFFVGKQLGWLLTARIRFKTYIYITHTGA